jgi:hypothetical protein
MYRSKTVRGLFVAIVAAAAMVVSAAEADKPTHRELAEIAKQRAAAAAERVKQLKPATVANPQHVEEVAKVGLERGTAEFERMAEIERQKHAAELARAKGEGKLPPGVEEKPAKAPVSGRLVVALSSSMPDEMMRDYMRQLEGVPEAIVVLRGFVGGAHKVAPTGIWLERVRRKQPDCRDCPHFTVEIVVDPLTYQMLGITKVPAVTYLPGVQDLKHCDADILNAGSVAYGAVSVRAALKAVRSKQVDVPDELIRRLGG